VEEGVDDDPVKCEACGKKLPDDDNGAILITGPWQQVVCAECVVDAYRPVKARKRKTVISSPPFKEDDGGTD
jgi:hypothetical protein